MRFDLTDLRLFLQVHACGTITRAAATNHMTLASASERIRGMEDALGVPLLVREQRGVRLTPAGRTLARHAQLVLHEVERMHGELAAHGHGARGHVRMLCNTSALTVHLPDVLASFLSQQPGFSVDLEERGSEDIADAVRNDLCDVGMVSDAADLAGLQTWPFRPDPLVLVVPRGHALAGARSATLAQLAGEPFVGLSESSALQALLSRQARRQGYQLECRIRMRSFESVCRLVGAGIGVGIVPQAVAARCARSTGLRRIALADDWARRQLVLCARRLERLSPAAQQMAAHVLAASRP